MLVILFYSILFTIITRQSSRICLPQKCFNCDLLSPTNLHCCRRILRNFKPGHQFEMYSRKVLCCVRIYWNVWDSPNDHKPLKDEQKFYQSNDTNFWLLPVWKFETMRTRNLQCLANQSYYSQKPPVERFITKSVCTQYINNARMKLITFKTICIHKFIGGHCYALTSGWILGYWTSRLSHIFWNFWMAIKWWKVFNASFAYFDEFRCN